MKYMKGLRISENDGEGEVILPEWFMESDPLLRAFVLKDWLYDITNLYNDAVEDFENHYGSKSKKAQ